MKHISTYFFSFAVAMVMTFMTSNMAFANDYAADIADYAKLANEGNVKAQTKLGSIYLYGVVVSFSYFCFRCRRSWFRLPPFLHCCSRCWSRYPPFLHGRWPSVLKQSWTR
ncbi:MAG: hypothetical protein P8L77_04490, partial [Gammaproteobacteria bacterium]|nr:hypothetical protein [Gammaproteobacteria bacterium]